MLRLQKFIRNVAVIAHVDHGKTTLVDSLLKVTGQKFAERAMDSLDLERERGITILSKCTSINYNKHNINIVDTPGHSDFGGQVERIMNIVDGVLLVVCATEGPMPQTRFVLKKALMQKLKPIVVMNKLDRPTARPELVESQVMDLFFSLNATDEQMEYPVLYASGRDGWCDREVKGPRKDCSALLDTIISHIPAPAHLETGPFKMLVSMTDSSQYFGKMALGRVAQGEIKMGDSLHCLSASGEIKTQGKVMRLEKHLGKEVQELQSAFAGDIIRLGGIQCSVTDTIAVPEVKAALPVLAVDPPTLTLKIRINDSPLSGTEGAKITLHELRKRLLEEAENDVALQVREGKAGAMEVSGRGELHLGILLEKLRREDFEFSVEAPKIITVKVDGKEMEPVEKVIVEVGTEYSNKITELFLARLAEFLDVEDLNQTHVRLKFEIPTRAMMGFKASLVSATKGAIMLESSFARYIPVKKGKLEKRSMGIILASSTSVCSDYGLSHLDEKGTSFVWPGAKVYMGMIIGETQQEKLMELNPGKTKRLTNVRSMHKDDNIKLNVPKTFTIEEAFSYIEDDELVEVTPKSIRLRKKELSAGLRKRDSRRDSDD